VQKFGVGKNFVLFLKGVYYPYQGLHLFDIVRYYFMYSCDGKAEFLNYSSLQCHMILLIIIIGWVDAFIIIIDVENSCAA